MSKHKEKKIIELPPKKVTKEIEKKEEPSKGEKIFNLVVSLLGAIAIITILIVTIINHENEFSKAYDGLDENNVYSKISYDKITSKINKSEEFYLVVCNNDYEDENIKTSDIIISIDKIAKENNIEKIYFIDVKLLNDEEKHNLYYTYGGKVLTSSVFDAPCLMHFKNNDGVFYSKNISAEYNVEKYNIESSDYLLKLDSLFRDYFNNSK